MYKHKIKKIKLNNKNNSLKSTLKKISIYILIYILIFFAINTIITAQDNNTANEADDTQEINDNEESSEDTESDENTDSEGEGDEEESSEDNSFKRQIEYDETVKEADKKLYEKFEQDVKYGISEKKEEMLDFIKKSKKSHFLPLIELILEDEKNHDVIIKTVSTAVSLQYHEASDEMEQYLELEDMKVLTTVVNALGIFKYKPLESWIDEFLDTENKALKNATILAIGRLKLHDYTFELIDDIYYDPDSEEVHQESIVKALGMLGNEDALAFLLEVYEDDTNSTSQRALAFRGLIINKYGNIHDHLEKAISGKNIKLKFEAVGAMMLLDKEEVPLDIVHTAIKDDDLNVRMGILRVIAQHKINDEETIDYIKYIIERDPKEVIKYTAVGTYLAVDKDAAVQYIEERLAMGDTNVKTAVGGLLHLLPKDKAKEYAEDELNSTKLSNNEFEGLLKSIHNIENDGGLELLMEVAKNPTEYNSTKNSLEKFQLVIKELTKFEENEQVHKLFVDLIKNKKSLTALALYPDLYTDDMTSIMFEVVKNEEYGFRMRQSAVWNIIQFGETEDHVKLKRIYESEDIDKNIKYRIKTLFGRVGIDINLLGEDGESSNDNTVAETEVDENDNSNNDENDNSNNDDDIDSSENENDNSNNESSNSE